MLSLKFQLKVIIKAASYTKIQITVCQMSVKVLIYFSKLDQETHLSLILTLQNVMLLFLLQLYYVLLFPETITLLHSWLNLSSIIILTILDRRNIYVQANKLKEQKMTFLILSVHYSIFIIDNKHFFKFITISVYQKVWSWSQEAEYNFIKSYLFSSWM